jgi:hypothetical protein
MGNKHFVFSYVFMETYGNKCLKKKPIETCLRKLPQNIFSSFLRFLYVNIFVACITLSNISKHLNELLSVSLKCHILR